MKQFYLNVLCVQLIGIMYNFLITVNGYSTLSKFERFCVCTIDKLYSHTTHYMKYTASVMESVNC